MSNSQYRYDISSDILQLIERSAINIEVLRGKKIFVTGGTGFFGIWLLSTLVQIKNRLKGDLKVVVLTRSSEKFFDSYPEMNFKDMIEFINGDVRNFKYALGDITHLVHMATTSANETFSGEDQLNKLEMLYFGTKNTLLQCTGILESVLFTSSGVAYGVNKNAFISENDFTSPDTTDQGSALGLGKLNAEFLINYFAIQENYRFVIARCFALAGPYLPMNIHYAFGNFIRNVIDGQQVLINGNGLDQRSYLFIGDAIAWLLRMLVDPTNKVYNIGSEKSISMYELAHKIQTQYGENLGIKLLGKNVEIGNFKRASYTPNTQRARMDFIGIEEWTSIDEIIEKMLKVLT